MKIIAWNVNGLRSLLKTNILDELLEEEKPNIFCMGETKLSCNYDIDEEMEKRFPKYKFRYWSTCAKRGGYSGTAILCKKEPLSVNHGLYNLDDEGRVITIELEKYYLVHVYTPNSGQALERLEWRTKIWDKAFKKYIKELQEKKQVIVCGDLNVAHTEIDLKNPKTNLKTAGYTVEERESFEELLNKNELLDVYRELYPDKIEYSYWSYMRKSRDKNVGWRIDYFLVSKKLKNKVKENIILTNIFGSDHAPIKLKII
jgi:exodeoxyribonuclease-3